MMRTKRQHAGLQIRCLEKNKQAEQNHEFQSSFHHVLNSRRRFRSLHTYINVLLRMLLHNLIRSIRGLMHASCRLRIPILRVISHLLIGANLYGSLLLNDLRQGPIGTPTAQSTALGWILSSPTSMVKSTNEYASVSHIASDANTYFLLRAF